VVNGLEIKKGSKVKGRLKVGPYFPHKRAHLRRWVMIPYTVIRGREDGSVLCITAGCHPTEYSGIDAAIRLTREIDPKELTGTLIVVPLVNVPGFYERTYINPIDGKNLQGLYPGIPRENRGEAFQSTMISDLMTSKIWNEIILKGNYVVDFHGGDLPETPLWYVAVPYTGNETVDKKSEGMALATGIKFISYPKTKPRPGDLKTESAKIGKPSILFEVCTGGLLLEKESQAIFDGTLNVMRYLGMLDTKLTIIKEQPSTIDGQKPVILTRQASVDFTKRGLYYSKIEVGARVTKGEKVGELKNLDGDVIEEIFAPATGIVNMVIPNPVKLEGDRAIRVAF
jgi:predicted deacylase